MEITINDIICAVGWFVIELFKSIVNVMMINSVHTQIYSLLVIQVL